MPACCCRTTLGWTLERLERWLKKLPREAPDSVSHKPECADLRKNFPACWRCLRHLGHTNNAHAAMHRHPDPPSTTIAIEVYRAFRFAVRRSRSETASGFRRVVLGLYSPCHRSRVEHASDRGGGNEAGSRRRRIRSVATGSPQGDSLSGWLSGLRLRSVRRSRRARAAR